MVCSLVKVRSKTEKELKTDGTHLLETGLPQKDCTGSLQKSSRSEPKNESGLILCTTSHATPQSRCIEEITLENGSRVVEK